MVQIGYHASHAQFKPSNLLKWVQQAEIAAKTAEWLGSWADGLITVSRPPEKLQSVVDAFRRRGGAGKPMILKVQLSYDRDQAIVKQNTHQQ